jgi:dienelactone hydrolase
LLRKDRPQVGPSSQRFVALNVDGSNLQSMPELFICFEYDHLRDQPPFDWLPDVPEVLVHCGWKPPELLNTYTGRLTDINGAGEVGAPAGLRYFPGWSIPFLGGEATRPGNLGREQVAYGNNHGLINLYRGRENNVDRWFVRNAADSPWQEFRVIDPLASEVPFRPLGYGTDLDRAFNVSWDPDTETWGLFRQDLTGEFENRLLFAHGTVDVELVDTMGKYDRVVAAAFLDGRPQRAIVDSRVAEVYQTLSSQWPEFDIEVVDESWDQNLYLARLRAPNATADFVLVDMANQTVSEIGPEYDHLSTHTLAETRLVQFESSSEGTIAAHLTLPVDVEGPVPAVIIPRARPSHEDIADPHYLVQFLAASGYAVLRVQNRIDAEYGRGWLEERAIIGWRQSAADIKDAIDYLVDTGIAPAGRICAAGKDYGAHVALMSAIEYPDLIQCVVSIAGITDPRAAGGMLDTEIIPAARPSESGTLLAQASPIRRVDELAAPVLMFNGVLDQDVYFTDQMLVFSTVLERAGQDVVAIEYPMADHAIRRKPDRVDMLARIGGFLSEHIGPILTD